MDRLLSNVWLPPLSKLDRQFLMLVFLLSLSQMISAAECAVGFSIPKNQWHQISLPCDPGENNTAADILADDFTGIYDQDWAIYRYDATTLDYVNIGEFGRLQTGVGYWVIQISTEEAILDMTGTMAAEISAAEVSQCPDLPGRCIEVPLVSTGNFTWNMGGFPSIARLGWQKIKIVDSAGNCADTRGCNVNEAVTSNILHDELWHFDGEEYRVIRDNLPLHPWEGFWAVTLGQSVQPKMILPVNYGGYQPTDQSIAIFDTISPENWDENAVRKVLHAFAYGGQATAEQIEAWANLSPRTAIVEILSFDEFNPLLSPPVPEDSVNLGNIGGTLEALGAFWSSDDPSNDVDDAQKHWYQVPPVTDNVRTDIIWERAVLSRGLNPFRQKIGLWETNYHLSVNLDRILTHPLVFRYYDDICDSLSTENSYAETLNVAALSAAIARQYGHEKNVYSNAQCQCNEDFAREYFQLFFGILGEDNPEYHETVTIKNTAKALTDMRINQSEDFVTFGTARHYPYDLEILNTLISGTRADQRLSALSQVAIEHPESQDNLPKLIIAGLANDNLSASNIREVRSVWRGMTDKNLLHFLRGYAISKQFHQSSRIKFLSSFDRNTSIYQQTTLNNDEVDLYSLSFRRYKEENVELFRPKHNVFGGQTGFEASASSEIFRLNYNRSTEKNIFLLRNLDTNRNWKKNWAAAIPDTYTQNYRVTDVGEFLWIRYIGDGLKNYGVLERTYVNALLAANSDWATTVDPDNLERIFSRSELLSDTDLVSLRQSHAEARIALDSENVEIRLAANESVGKAINFITATPYIFAQEGR